MTDGAVRFVLLVAYILFWVWALHAADKPFEEMLYPERKERRENKRMKTPCAGERRFISGDSKDMWIDGYNVRVSSYCTVLENSSNYDKKVSVQIDEIDGDRNVVCRVKKDCLKIAVELSETEVPRK